MPRKRIYKLVQRDTGEVLGVRSMDDQKLRLSNILANDNSNGNLEWQPLLNKYNPADARILKTAQAI